MEKSSIVRAKVKTWYRNDVLIGCGYLFLGLILFLYSMALITPYVNGDQQHYRQYYSLVADASDVLEIFQLSQFNLGSVEPVSTLVLWIGAYLGIEKDIYISTLNTILCLLLVRFLLKYKTQPLLILLFLTNFYLVVVMTGAERLKIAYIFLLIASLCNGKKSYLAYLSSLLSHFQMAILLFCGAFGLLAGIIRRFFFHLKIKKNILMFFVLCAIFSIAFLYLFSGHISSKFDSYSDRDFSIFDLWQISILGCASMFFGREKLKYFIVLALLFFPLVVFGGSRVNMIAFSIFIYFLVIEKRQNNIFVYGVSIYLSAKSLPFVMSIYNYGDGFYGILGK